MRSSFVIAGTGSGVGKTSISLGIARALRNRDQKVQCFKVGPDFLDPTYHKLASGNVCYNLDSWMSSPEYVSTLYHRLMSGADVGIVEGVMGLFDGANINSLSGSTAEIASIIKRPVVLVVDAKGAARSVCASVKGFCEFSDSIEVVGVIANRVGSKSHGELLKEALEFDSLPPLVGAIVNGSLPTLNSRHLGLISADEEYYSDATIDEIANKISESVDLDLLLSLTECDESPVIETISAVKKKLRVGVARDQAFQFTYEDNLNALVKAGVEIEYFSPCYDNSLPLKLDAIYLPGGYPEVYAETLSQNASMIESVKRFKESGRLIFGECGGLLYLCESLTDLEGNVFRLANLIQANATMLPRFKRLGYGEATFLLNSPFGEVGEKLKGHVFHYSEINESGNRRNAFNLKRRRGESLDGFIHENIFASYVHFHWASRPDVVKNFINSCENMEIYREEY